MTCPGQRGEWFGEGNVKLLGRKSCLRKTRVRGQGKGNRNEVKTCVVTRSGILLKADHARVARLKQPK